MCIYIYMYRYISIYIRHRGLVPRSGVLECPCDPSGGMEECNDLSDPPPCSQSFLRITAEPIFQHISRLVFASILMQFGSQKWTQNATKWNQNQVKIDLKSCNVFGYVSDWFLRDFWNPNTSKNHGFAL